MGAWRRVLANIVIVAFLACICVDGCPNQGVFHRHLRAKMDPIVDKVGIWQGSWSVFAPEVDRENFHLELQVEYDDGTVQTWHSPDWKNASAWDKLVRFRELEYTEAIRTNGNSKARPELARYLAERLKPNPTAKPVWVELTSHSVKLDPPTDEPYQPRGEHPEHSYVELLYEESFE